VTAATKTKAPDTNVTAFRRPDPPKRTEFSRRGLGYVLKVDEASTVFGFHHVKRRSGEIVGDIIVKTRIDGVKTVNGILHAARLNMSSTAAREKLANLLKARAPGVDFDWFHYLEELSIEVTAALAEGEPIEEIGHDAVDWSAPQYAVSPLVPLHEPGLIYGPGGSGKSLIALTIAIATAAGRELIPGTTQQAKGPVLYLDWETNRKRVNRRIVSVCQGAEIEVPRGIFYRREFRTLADDAEELAAFVIERGIVFVVIDSAAQAIGHQGEYGDANEGALRLFEGIRLLGQVSTLIVDHVSKNELMLAGKRGRVPYGSVYKINYSRAAWEIRPGEKTDSGALRLALHDFKRNDDAEHPPMGLQIAWTEGRVAYSTDDPAAINAEPPPPTDPDDEGSLGDQIYELLKGSRMKAPKIADTLNANPGSVRDRLNKDPRFEREPSGFWIVARDHIPL
jgi:hypothetical protein